MKLAFKQSYLTSAGGVLLAALVVSSGALGCGDAITPCAKIFIATGGSCKQLSMMNNFSCWPEFTNDRMNGKLQVKDSGFSTCSVNVDTSDQSTYVAICRTSETPEAQKMSYYFKCQSADGSNKGHWSLTALAGYVECIKGIKGTIKTKTKSGMTYSKKMIPKQHKI